jgi:molybdopterin-binding protein
MNELAGHIIEAVISGGVAVVDVDVGGLTLTAAVVGAPELWVAPGTAVRLVFKPTEVALGKGLSGGLTIRNRLPCRVGALECGRVLSRVRLTCSATSLGLEAIVTTRAVQALGLAPGDAVEALVKTNEMTLLPALPARMVEGAT